MSAAAASILVPAARRAITSAAPRPATARRLLSSVSTAASSGSEAGATAAPGLAGAAKHRYYRSGCHHPAKGVVKFGVLGLATYGGYKLVTGDSNNGSTSGNVNFPPPVASGHP